MPTLVNNLRAIRGPVTAVPVTAGSGIEIAADTQNNQIVISSNLEAGSGIEIVDDNGKAKIINSDNAQALPIVAGAGVKLSVVNNQVVVSADETVLFEYTGTGKNMSTSFTVSEPLTNFETIKIKCVGYPGDNGQLVYCEVPAPRNSSENFSFTTLYYCAKNDSNPLQIIGQRYSTSDGLTYTVIDKKMLYWGSTATTPTSTNANMLAVMKIVGINRLSN